MQLTDDQKAAAAAFAAFMVSNDREMVVSGPAGVGKTTLLKHLMNDPSITRLQGLLGVEPITEWRLSATTNKAAEVLQSSVGQEASTVHSLLDITLRNDFKTGMQIMTRKPGATVLHNSLLVVDEASMIDTKLDQLIQQSTHNCKILYVGDHCQMAPVMEDLSPVFRRNTVVELRQIVRSQHTPDITALCRQLRTTVETGVFRPIEEVPGVIDYLSPEQAEAEIEATFVHDALGNESARILAYRNEQVIGFNAWLRAKRGLPDYLTPGEWVVSNQSTQIQGTNQRLRIEQDVEIIEITDEEDFNVASNVSLRVRRVLTQHGWVFVTLDRAHYDALIKHYAKEKEWFHFFKLKENIADLRPRDACTVYKAQGSTYHTVFVDLKDIGRCTVASQAARMLYVACSRPTHRICFIGNLPARLRGG